MILKILQRGSLLISAIFLVVVIGFISATLMYIGTTATRASLNQLDALRAYYIADGGLRRAMTAMAVDVPTQAAPVVCTLLNGHTLVTNVALGEGQFTVNVVANNTSSATLNGNINDTVTTIPVNSITGYAMRGRIMIDSEAMDYRGISGNSFILVTRGAGGTTATTHTSGTAVFQNQCQLTSTGAIPTVASPTIAKQQEEETVFNGNFGSGGWVVGDLSSYETFLGFNGLNWVRQASSAIDNVRFNGVFMCNRQAAVAAGDKISNNTKIRMWNGSTWASRNSNSLGRQNMNAVTCTNPGAMSGYNWWVVGNGGVSIFAPAGGYFGTYKTGVSENLYAIACIASNNCWAVGAPFSNGGGQSPRVIYFVTSWNKTTSLPVFSSGTNPTLYGIARQDTQYYLAVGATTTQPIFLRCDSATNSCSAQTNPVGLPANTVMRAISCVSANDCWAVGYSGTTPIFTHFDGTSWSYDTTLVDSSVPTQALLGVSCASSDDCWAVGKAGTVVFWNGYKWQAIQKHSTIPSVSLNAISVLPGFGRINMLVST